jgi:SAM-dependent methyltransferase
MQSTERFSRRVENYRRYRPSYPAEVIELMRKDGGLRAGARVSDVGSGTGILTRLLLEAGWEIDADEPNGPMREAAEADLGHWPGFHSIAATAEATTLPDHSVAAIVCAQAFHWFDREAAGREFRRILRPGGLIFLVWNERREDSEFDGAYEAMIDALGAGRAECSHGAVQRDLVGFFRPGTYREASFSNPQPMDWEALRGRFLSSSYVPLEEDPRHPQLLGELEELFQRYQRGGQVVFSQNAWVYFGQV